MARVPMMRDVPNCRVALPLGAVIARPLERLSRMKPVPSSVVGFLIELAIISWIRMRFMDTPFLRAAFQVVVGGTLVFVAGILIGSS